MGEELNCVSLHVCDAVEKKLVHSTEDFKLLRMRWVICSKGDKQEYGARARLAACKTNTYNTDEYFASTPRHSKPRTPCSASMLPPHDALLKSDDYVLSFVNITKACLNEKPQRNVHLAFPKQMGVPDHLCAHLKRCVYGTRDAGAIWEECCASARVDMGFVRRVAGPCCFFHADHRLMVVVHGDDLKYLSSKRHVIHYEDQLKFRFEIKRRGHSGESDGYIKEIRTLTRILRLAEDRLRYEADARHAEMPMKALGLEKASSVRIAGIKEDNDATDYDAERVNEDVLVHEWSASDSPIPATPAVRKPDGRTVSVDLDNAVVHDVVAYSDVYGIHPKAIVANRDG